MPVVLERRRLGFRVSFIWRPIPAHLGGAVDGSSSRGIGRLPSHVDTLGGVPVLATFEFNAFIAAVDSERRKQELTWVDLAEALWDQSAELNAHRNDHPL